MLNTSKWKNFNLEKLFEISAGIYHYSDEYDIDFDIMVKFELDLETVKSLNLLDYENF